MRPTAAGRDVSSIKRALVSGAAFPTSLQEEIKSRGVEAYQAFGTADLGLIAFETPAREGMVVNEDLILEIVRPGTGDPVAEGDVGEIVVTSLDPDHPWIRLALGDLTAALPGTQPLRTHQYAHQGLDGPRRPDHQGQGHVRAARADRRDRQASSRTRTAAPRRHPRGRDRCDDAEGGMRLTGRGAARTVAATLRA